MTEMLPQMRTVRLDSLYLLTYMEKDGKLSGEVVRENGESYNYNTHVFDVPEQFDELTLKAWAERALQAYREG